MTPLTSPQNPLLQKVRRAVSAGRPLDDGLVAAEGPHLLAEALAGSWPIDHILHSAAIRDRHAELLSTAARRNIRITEVADRAFEALTSTEHGQGILALLRPRAFTWPDLLDTPGPLVILDGLQDPGNAGTILRSAEAFGGCGVIFTEGSVRVSNGKLLRSAAGSLFRLPYLENLGRAEILRHVISKRNLFSLQSNGDQSLANVSLTAPFALVVGSEGAGVSPLFQQASKTLSIPTRAVESLNAAVACAIALFEAARQNGFPR